MFNNKLTFQKMTQINQLITMKKHNNILKITYPKNFNTCNDKNSNLKKNNNNELGEWWLGGIFYKCNN